MKYEIRDRSGALVAIHERQDTPQGKRFIWWEPDESGTLHPRLTRSTSELPLYRIEQVSGRSVVLVEGEKAADAVAAAGLLDVVGTVCGASVTPSRSVLSELAGLSVILWPDNDEPGREHMQRIAARLTSIASSIFWVDPSSLPYGADAADCSEEQIAELIATAQRYTPTAFPEAAFERVGYRSFRLAGEGWEVRISSILAKRNHGTARVGIYCADERGYADLGGLIVDRTISLWSSVSITNLAKEVSSLTKEPLETWRRRIDYALSRAIRHDVGHGLVASAADAPSISWLFMGRCIRGRTISLYGPGGTGKSTLADGLALSLANGVSIVPLWVPSERERVLLLDWDEGHEEWSVRVRAICRGHGCSADGYRYLAVSDPLWKLVDRIGELVVAEGITVIIISPVSRALRDASDQGDAAGPVHELYDILRQLGTTNILIDHVAGTDLRSGEAPKEYGSVAKRDHARGSYSVFTAGEHVGAKIIKISNTKPVPLAPRIPEQFVKIIYDPPNPLNGIYRSIRFVDAR